MGKDLGHDYGSSHVVHFRLEDCVCLFFLFFLTHQPLVNVLSNRNLSQFCHSINPYQHTRVCLPFCLRSLWSGCIWCHISLLTSTLLTITINHSPFHLLLTSLIYYLRHFYILRPLRSGCVWCHISLLTSTLLTINH